jgi:serine protease
VTAGVLNVTVTNTTQSSFLTVWPTAKAQPPVSDLNWAPGQTVPNLVVVELGSDGAVQVFNAAGSTDVIVDVSGWYS